MLKQASLRLNILAEAIEVPDSEIPILLKQHENVSSLTKKHSTCHYSPKGKYALSTLLLSGKFFGNVSINSSLG